MSLRHAARPAILRRIPLDRHVVIEASAGTGKTFTLEHLVIELLLSTDVAVDRLLVVTFTEKATHELRARIRAKLEALSSGTFEPASEAEVRAGDAWAIDDPAREKLARSLHALDGASIATIHAFCQRLLRENSFAGGRLFEEQQVDAREAFGRAFRDVLRQEIAAEPARARWLEGAIANGMTIPTLEDLLWKAATSRGEIHPAFDAPRLEAALDAFPLEDAQSLTRERIKRWGVTHGSTLTSLCKKIGSIREAVDRARDTGSPAAYLAAAEDAELDFAYVEEKLTPLSPPPGADADVHAALLRLARASVSLSAALVQVILPRVRRALTQTKREAGRYDFDDMLSLVDDALRGPNGDALAAAMRARYRYVFIDEFQDTDETQWSIFRRAFYGPPRTAAEVPSRLVLIGDPKQSIYRFRGADVETYIEAKRDVLASGGESVALEHNFRATAALVEATNALFDPAAAEPLFTGEVRYAPVACGRPDRTFTDGDGDAATPVEVLRLPPDLPSAELGSVLAAEIAREIRTLTDPLRPYRLDGRALEPRDVFVLTRSTREGVLIGRALQEARIPHAFYKEEGLFQSEEAQEVRCLLAAIDDPTNRSARLAAWMTPFFGLVLSEVEHAKDLPDSHPFVERLREWKILADRRDFDRLFESILWDSGVLRREIFFAPNERSLTNTMHLFEVLTDRVHAGHKTLGDLVLDLAGLRAKTKLPLDVIEGNVKRLESDRSAVQIMTIHKAKGLEAPVVFVGALFGSMPDRVRVYHDAHRRKAWVGSSEPEAVDKAAKVGEREEDERLLYVALTRAMGRLYLPHFTSKGRRSAYEPVNRRITALLAKSEATLGVRDIVRDAPPTSAAPTSAASSTAPGASWRPDVRRLRSHDGEGAYDTLRARHAGALVTSYTRMKAKQSGARGGIALSVEDRREESARERAAEGPRGLLRSARTSGIFLHELLERVPIASFAAPDVNAWRAQPDVAALVAEAIAVHRVDPAQREHAETLVWTAYTTPVALPEGRRIDGFARARRVAREMEFVFPLRPVEESTDGYVRGSLDLAFEHDGLTYFVDWKSDSLESYEGPRLAEHVARHYEDQWKLYALAVMKLLGLRTEEEYVARFGGFLYCFLRGFDRNGAGLWAFRPAFGDMMAWERDLQASRAGGPE
jgi:exodeoxyribonuclease V beta subunit